MHTDIPGITATELQGADAQEAMVKVLAGDLELQPMEQGAAKHLGASHRDDVWQQLRRDVERDRLAELNSRATNNLGLWS